jgi:hypothetical protein
VRDTALATLLNKKLRRGLKPVFETRVRRKVFQMIWQPHARRRVGLRGI